MSVMWSRSGGRAIVKAIKIPYPSYTGIILYTGSAIQPAWTNYDENKITIGGTVTAINAGTYTTSFTPKEGFCWENGSTTAYSVKWTIYKEKLVVPSQSGTLYYDGGTLSPNWENYNSSKMTMGGTKSAFTAGTYEATFTLKSGYIWSDGTTATKKVAWKISKVTPTIVVEPSSITMSLSKNPDGVQVILTATNLKGLGSISSTIGGSTEVYEQNSVYISGLANNQRAFVYVPRNVGTARASIRVIDNTNYSSNPMVYIDITVTA